MRKKKKKLYNFVGEILLRKTVYLTNKCGGQKITTDN